MTKEDRQRFTFRIPRPLFERLQEEASRLGVSVNALILQILWEWAKSADETINKSQGSSRE